MTNHYVRHMLQEGGYGISTEFMCAAPFGAPCRLACDRCIRNAEEQCVCAYQDDPRPPDLQDQGECNYVEWLRGSPEEVYNGEGQPVRGPDWQGITPEWTGDNWEWDYADG